MSSSNTRLLPTRGFLSSLGFLAALWPAHYYSATGFQPAGMSAGQAVAAALRADGVVRVNGVLGAGTTALLLEHVNLSLDGALREGRTRGRVNDADDEAWAARFGNVLSRRHRYDLKLSFREAPPVRAALAEVLEALEPTLAEALGGDAELYELAALVSRPGAKRQPVHPDTPIAAGKGTEGAEAVILTAFCALQDVDAAMGPTLFLPASHTADRHAAFFTHENFDLAFDAGEDEDEDEEDEEEDEVEDEVGNDEVESGSELGTEARSRTMNEAGRRTTTTMTRRRTRKRRKEDETGLSLEDLQDDARVEALVGAWPGGGGWRSELSAGDVSLYDSRCLHAGTANRSDQQRVLFYCSFIRATANAATTATAAAVDEAAGGEGGGGRGGGGGGGHRGTLPEDLRGERHALEDWRGWLSDY